MRLTSIDTLTNRQVDALIASKVMNMEISIVLQDGELDPNFADGRPVPLYSTNIIAAWQLVQFIAQSGESIAIDYIASEKQWRCLINDKITTHRAIDVTPELAICCATLKEAGILGED